MEITGLLLLAIEIGLVVAVTALVALLVTYVVSRLMRQSAPVAAVGARRLGALVVWVIGGSFALQLAGVSPEILFLVVALFGLAAIIALRQPLENFGAKVFSDVYIPYKVGDTVKVGELSGKVLEINAMATVLLSPENQLVSIPNRAFLDGAVVNTSPQAWKELTIPVTVPSTIDLPAFESALLRGFSKLKTRLDPRFPPVLATKARGSQGTDLILTVMIRRPEDREAILGESTKRVSEALVSASPRRGERTA